MNKKRRKLLIGLLVGFVIILMIILLIGSIFSKNNDEQIENDIYDNGKAIEDKIIANISFTNIKCYFSDNVSLLEYTITNNGEESIILGEYKIIVKDKVGNILATMFPTISFELNPGESYDAGDAINVDLSNVHTIELQLNEE